jgi:hypothetical protein
MTINDLLLKDKNSGTIQVAPDNFVTLVYRGKLLSLQASDFIIFPSQSYSSTTPALTPADITAFTGLPVGSNYSVTPYTQTIVFNTNNTADIDSIIFQAGTTFDVNVSSMFMHNMSIKIDIPAAKKNGIPFSQTINLTYTGNLPVVSNNSFNVSGYTFDMTKGGTTQNTFDVNIAAVITKSANPLNLSDNATLNIGFTNPKFQKLFGYIKQPLIAPGADTVALTIFDNAMPGGGTFTIVNPDVHVAVTNSYGVPIDATFNLLEGFNPPASTYPISVAAEPKLNPWHLPYPTVVQIGQSVSDSVILSNTNTSNTLSNVINQHPKKMIYKVNAQANPNGKPVAPNTNFSLDTSRVTIDLQIDLPLYGTAKNMLLRDTARISMGTNIDQAEWILFRIHAVNGFPIDMGLQAYFTDSVSAANQYNVLDSLISPYQIIMPAAGVDASGKVNSPTTQTTDIKYDKTRLAGIKKATKLIIQGKFNTTNNGNTNVKIYSDYKLDFQVGVEAQIKTKF